MIQKASSQLTSCVWCILPLRVKQLDLLDPKLEYLAALQANNPEYKQMIRHIEQGIKEDQLEENSELRKMVGNTPNSGLQSLSTGKLIVKNGNNKLGVSCAKLRIVEIKIQANKIFGLN